MTGDYARARPSAVRVQLLLAIALATATARARAETAVLLSPRGDQTLKHERDAAQRFLRETLADQAVRVLPRDEAVAELAGDDHEDCDAIECAPALLRGADADVAVALAIWASGDPPRAGTVFVTLVDRRGVRYPGKARVEEDTSLALDRGVKDALLDARALQLLGPGPWLRVRGKPEGAEVLLDGKLVGTLPYRAQVSAGRQTLEVRADGHRTHAQTVDVPESAARQVEVDVELEERGADDAGQGAADAGSDAIADDMAEPDAGSRAIVGPVILGTVGVALIAVDVAAALSVGCERKDSMGVCLERDSIEEVPAVVVGGVGVLAVAGALFWYLIDAPSHPVEHAAAAHGVSMSIAGDGLSVTGHF